MPTRRNKEEESLDELVNELQNAGWEIESAVNDIEYDEEKVHTEMKTPKEATDKTMIEERRSLLIKCSEDGEIDQSVKYLKKASAIVITKIYNQLEAKRLEKANAFVTDMLISRFSGMLGGLDAIESSEELDKELQR